MVCGCLPNLAGFYQVTDKRYVDFDWIHLTSTKNMKSVLEAEKLVSLY